MQRQVCLLVVLTLAGVAAAKTPDPRATEARTHFESGMAHFNLQEYEAAIPEFEAAYRLRPDPVFLYNLAQTHRLAGHVERALYFYRAYLRSNPGASERDEIETRIRDLQAQLDAKTKAAEPTPTNKPATPATPPPATVTSSSATVTPPPLGVTASAAPEKPRQPVYKKWWLWTTVGAVVVAGAAVGVTLALVPKNASIPGNTDGNVAVTFH